MKSEGAVIRRITKLGKKVYIRQGICFWQVGYSWPEGQSPSSLWEGETLLEALNNAFSQLIQES